MNDDPLITISGLQACVARRGATISEGTIRDLANRGIITSVRDSSGRRLFTVAAVDQLVAHLNRRRSHREPIAP
jgi:DNA-binding transcriptional MerR regulator